MYHKDDNQKKQVESYQDNVHQQNQQIHLISDTTSFQTCEYMGSFLQIAGTEVYFSNINTHKALSV